MIKIILIGFFGLVTLFFFTLSMLLYLFAWMQRRGYKGLDHPEEHVSASADRSVKITIVVGLFVNLLLYLR